jgi:hypothetical protein
MLALRDFEMFRTGAFQASAEAIQRATEEAEAAIKKIASAGTASINSTVQDGQRQAELMSQMLMRVNQVLGELPAMAKLELPSERLERQFVLLTGNLETVINQLEAITGLVRKRTGIRRRRWYWLYLR